MANDAAITWPMPLPTTEPHNARFTNGVAEKFAGFIGKRLQYLHQAR
jgi:hypothetical protein